MDFCLGRSDPFIIRTDRHTSQSQKVTLPLVVLRLGLCTGLFLGTYTHSDGSNNRKANIFVHFTWFLLILLTALGNRETVSILDR